MAALPSYKVVDLGLRWSMREQTALDFKLNNVFDEFYAAHVSGDGVGGGNWNVGAPRSFEVSVTTGF
jgi:outer membrane receptor protein involved in Fe transport